MSSTTTFMLMAAFDSRPTVPLEEICEPYLGLPADRAIRLANRRALGLPTFKMRDSQKAPHMVHLEDLAKFIDQKAAKARHDHERVNS